MLQHNANLDTKLQMRVGIPHTGGSLAFHAFEEQYSCMVSANAFWNNKTRKFRTQEASNLHDLDWALDSAGFTAIKLWQTKGLQPGMAGVFPWTYEQYIELASFSGCAWYAQADLCCEPELANSQHKIDYRINATATLLEGMLRVIYAWQSELAKSGWSDVMIANTLKPPVPVVQGWCADDYRRSFELMQQVWSRWEPWLAPPALIGIGSVCRRNLHDPDHGLYAILDAIEDMVPSGSRLHLFGVKGLALGELRERGYIASVDSMAWDMGSRVKSRTAQVPNSIARRTSAMSEWMREAQSRLRSAKTVTMRPAI